MGGQAYTKAWEVAVSAARCSAHLQTCFEQRMIAIVGLPFQTGGNIQMRRTTMVIGAVAAMACGATSSKLGPGLPTCSRPAGSSECVVTWHGTLEGSGTCSQTVTSGASGQGWTLFVTGSGGTSTVEIGIALQGAPPAGTSWTMRQMVSGDAKLTDTSSPAGWEATGSQGDLALQVDSVVQGSGNVHGSFSGSLAPNPGAGEPGIQVCVFL